QYKGKIDTPAEILLGSGYSLLRREFRTAAVARAPRDGRPLRVLVTFGGSDTENISQHILERLGTETRQHLHVIVVAGAANRNVVRLRAAAARAPFHRELHADVENLSPLMAWADVAVSAAGSTVWELAAMHLPALIGAAEGNQLAVLRGLPGIPFFRAGTTADLLAWDLVGEIESLLARPANTDWQPDNVDGATRVAASLRERIPTVATAS
ncbi:MAG: glycosyltransferase, partial [Opitutaceae bacterium]